MLSQHGLSQLTAKTMMTSSNESIFRVTGHLCGNSPITSEFPPQRPVTRSFDIFFDLRLNKRLCKQWWSWWFETPSYSLWRHCNALVENLSLCVFALYLVSHAWLHGPHLLAWMNNYIYYKVWGEMIYQFTNYNGTTVEVLRFDNSFHPHFTGRAICTGPRYVCHEVRSQKYIINKHKSKVLNNSNI